MMDTGSFWRILDTARETAGEDLDGWFDALKNELLHLPPEEILQFRLLFDVKTGAAYKIDLWGAAYLINGGCSDDGFHYFRCWLVGQGRDVYEKALANPDSLADVLHGEWPLEAALDAAPGRAWQEKTGRPEADYFTELDRLTPEYQHPDEGEDWDFEDDKEMRRHFPRLCELYLTGEE